MKELHLTNDLNQLELLNDFLDNVCLEAGLNPRILMNLKLAVEEAVVNVITYAYPDQAGKDICLTFDKKGDCVEVRLADNGKPFNPLEKRDPDITLPEAERPIGGLGIFLVKKMMTKVTYNRVDGKNILIMIKELS